jgi:hypothetical protein
MPIYVNLFFCYAGAPEVLEFKTVYIIVSPFGAFKLSLHPAILLLHTLVYLAPKVYE